MQGKSISLCTFCPRFISYYIISSPDQNVSYMYCYHWASVVCLSLAFCILINFSKTTGPIWTKLWWNGPWVVPFQNCVQQSPPPPTKMAAITKNRKFGKESLKNYLLWNCRANWAQTMVEWSSDGPLWELWPTTLAANQDSHRY